MKSLLPCLLACLGTLTAGAQTDVVGTFVSWQRDPATTMTVTWVNLYASTPSEVWYRATTNSPWLTATGSQHALGPSTLQVRQVELTGLQPDTLYEFVLTQRPGKKLEDVRRFRTMPASLDRPVQFVVGGDMMHNREWSDAMNKRAGALEPDFAILGGDLAYADGVNATRWVDWLQSWTLHAAGTNSRCIPLVPVIGNHEVRGGYNGRIPTDAPYFYGLFPLPGGQSFYSLDFSDYLSVVAMDSGHTQPVPGPQTEWLDRTLAGRTAQRFVFPVYHYPAYGTAKAEPNSLPCDQPRAQAIRQHWIPHFERYGVTAVFEHDNHNYKRTHPLRAHQRDETNGIVYLGDGAWGVATRTVPTNAWYLAYAEPRRHLFWLTLETNGTAHAKAVDVAGMIFDETTFVRARTLPQNR